LACMGPRARLLGVTVPPEVLAAFPSSGASVKTSHATPAYNCHAWGADDPTRWWEPAPPMTAIFPPWVKIYWPTGLPHFDHTLTNFVQAFETIGYMPCANGELESGFEKLALYGDATAITHTARQLPGGTWTSKLGRSIDMMHPTLASLEGVAYGSVVAYMRRTRASTNVPETLLQ
jgi:hypothetical protein